MRINLPNMNREQRRAWYRKNKKMFTGLQMSDIVKEEVKEENNPDTEKK